MSPVDPCNRFWIKSAPSLTAYRVDEVKNLSSSAMSSAQATAAFLFLEEEVDAEEEEVRPTLMREYKQLAATCSVVKVLLDCSMSVEQRQ